MAEFLVLLHETPGSFANVSPSEMQAVIERYSAWAAKLGAAGKLVTGKKLRDEGGKRLRNERGRMVVSDGPYAEVKDIVGGLFIIQAASYEEASRLLADCPHLENGWIELREVEPT
jgi:hypothetical protein